MTYDFDKVIDRQNTNSLKYDFAVERGRPKDILPLWVADMDFQTLPEVIEVLTKTSQHGIFGYSEGKESYFKAIEKWFKYYFDWEVKEEWLVKVPGVVYAIAQAIGAFTKEGDAVIISEPVYYPFSSTILANNRKLVRNELVYKANQYTIDFETFERQIITHEVKLFILCSPHNPVGRVWTVEELNKILEICTRHKVIIVSDEIHADFTYEGHKHKILASLDEEAADQIITCTSPSKTFNLAGLQVSNVFIKNKVLRKKFQEEVEKSGYSQISVMGLVACETAYTYGYEWIESLKGYLAGNLAFLKDFLVARIPTLKLVEPEGTYLVWIDCSELKLSEEERQELIVNKAKLWLDSGKMFGKVGENFERINIACPRSTLEKALIQLEEAVNSIENKNI